MSGLRRKKVPVSPQESVNDDGTFAVQVFRERPPISPVYEMLPLSPRYCLQASIDDQAFCYFLKNFVLSPCKGNSRSYMSFVIPVMEEHKRNMTKSSTLAISVKAVSLALLGNRPNSRSLRPRAAKQYSAALKEVNHALQSPDLVLEDQTLAAVIVLGPFEACNMSEELASHIAKWMVISCQWRCNACQSKK